MNFNCIGSITDLSLFLYFSYTAKVLGTPTQDEIPSPDTLEKDKPVLGYYKVQLIDENAEGIEDCIKVVPHYKLK